MKKAILSETLLINLFPFSGMAALIYQICWQRLLYSSFGVDIESITIIVSGFMLGLGIGALIGGILADRFPNRILLFFILSEAIIGVFGILSPHIIAVVASRYIMASSFETGAVNFLLLLLPTSLMGATMPMLVIYLQRSVKHIGISVGTLYFANTLGASVGSFLVGFILFRFLTINESIYVGVFINAFISTIAGMRLWNNAST